MINMSLEILIQRNKESLDRLLDRIRNKDYDSKGMLKKIDIDCMHHISELSRYDFQTASEYYDKYNELRYGIKIIKEGKGYKIIKDRRRFKI